MHIVSQRLAVATKPGTWEPIGNWTEEDTYDLQKEASSELWNSPLGEALEARGGPNIRSEILENFVVRCPAPSAAPYFETLKQVMEDLLGTLPVEADVRGEPVSTGPTPEQVQYKKDAQVAQDAAREDRLKHLRKFAHMVNAAIAFGGIGCLKPKNGFICLKFEENGRPYEYKYRYGNGTGERDFNGNLITSKEYDQFMQDFEEATSRGLIQ
jgi:hypothetical protein